jgi:uncharacterized repeat protein (TIGR01451 family)/MYXO-CTERM domain-containing protein
MRRGISRIHRLASIGSIAFMSAAGALLAPTTARAQIMFETRSWPQTPAPSSTATAISIFDGLTGGAAGYGCSLPSTVNGTSNQTTIHGPDQNIAYHVSAEFVVSAAQAGTWQFRWGPDFGFGGTLLMDGQELQSRWSDMWWGGSFSTPTQYLQGSVNLAAGTHVVEVFGFESCCDGGTDAQFMPPGGVWQDISASNLTLVPEVCAPNVLVTASAAPNPVVDGAQITYTLNYASIGSDTATNVVLTDAVPANTTFVSASNGGAFSNGTVTWNLGALPSGTAHAVTMVVQVASPVADGISISDTASLAATNATTSTASTGVTVSNSILSLAATASPSPVQAGGTLTLTLNYMNTGSAAAQSSMISDLLPANTTFVSATNGGTYDSASNKVSWSLGSIAVGGSGSLSYTVAVASPLANGTSLTDSATFAASNNMTVSASASSNVSSAPSLSMTDTPTPNPVAAGAVLTYSFAYANQGTDAANGATLTEALPGNVTFQSASNGGTFDPSTGQITWSLGSIPAGTTGQLTATVLVATPLGNGTTLTDAASLAASNSATLMTNSPVTVTSAPALSLSETGAPNPVSAGGDLVYTLSYGNGGSDVARAVVISATVPANATFVSATAGGTYDSGSGAVGFNVGDVAPGSSGSVTFTVHVASPLANGTPLASSASATTTNGATAPASASVPVTSAPSLSLTESGSPNPVAAGGSITYSLVFANAGTDTGQNAVLSAVVPVDTTFVSASSGGSFDSGSNQVTWNLGSLAAGTNSSVSFIASVATPLSSGTTLTATASLAATNATTAPAMASATVQSSPTLSLTDTAMPSPLQAGSQLTYTLTFANNGSDAAHGVALIDTLPAQTTFVSASNGGTYDSGSKQVSWSLGDLAAAASGSVTLVVIVNASAPAGMLSDAASLSSSNGAAASAGAMTAITAAPGGGAAGSGGSSSGGGGMGVGGTNGTGTGGSNGGSAGAAGGGGATTVGTGVGGGFGGAGGSVATSAGGHGGTMMVAAAGSAGTNAPGSAGKPGSTGLAGEGGSAAGSETNASSGCGCSVGPSPSSSALWLVAVAAVMALRRRKRAR